MKKIMNYKIGQKIQNRTKNPGPGIENGGLLINMDTKLSRRWHTIST